MSRVLVTGGAGFIPSNLIRHLLEHTDHEVISLDALTYAGNLDNLADVMSHPRLEFVVSLQTRVDDLHRAVDEVAAALSRVDRRVDGAVTNTAVVRYDAYEGTGGQQSASVAMLDATRTGTVVTAIQGRDYARIYVKDLDRGRSPVALSPEEQEAVERAMSR